MDRNTFHEDRDPTAVTAVQYPSSFPKIPGVSTSPPSYPELMRFALLVLNNIKLDYHLVGFNRIKQAARTYEREQNKGYWPFFLYLCDYVFGMNAEERARAIDEDIARVCIDYSDPTGDQAVRNVLRERALNVE